jgi:hypothetical protein
MMQLRALLRLMLHACCSPMDVTSCSVPTAHPWIHLCAPRLLPAYGCSFVFHACCHAHGYSFVLRACCHASFSSHMLAGTAAPEETTFACVILLHLLMEHLQHRSICCNIRLKQMKHLQHTLETYMYGCCNICNIKIKHLQHV